MSSPVLLSRRLVIGGESAGGFTVLCALAAERLFFAVGASRYRQPLLALRHVAGENLRRGRRVGHHDEARALRWR